MALPPRPKFEEKRAWLIIVLGLAAIAGVIWATQLKIQNHNSTAMVEITNAQISEIVIGTPSSAAQLKVKDPILKQQPFYTTTDHLAMRVTTTAAVTKPYQMNVRLVAQDGSLVELDPPTVTFQPGRSTYCCWLVNKPGNYTMQIFRPERIVSTIPLVIQEALQQQQPALF